MHENAQWRNNLIPIPGDNYIFAPFKVVIQFYKINWNRKYTIETNILKNLLLTIKF